MSTRLAGATGIRANAKARAKVKANEVVAKEAPPRPSMPPQASGGGSKANALAAMWDPAQEGRAIGRRQMGHCMDARCGGTREERDFCTWGHSDHDLPAHCMHLTNCRNGDRCWFNHLKHAHEL